MRNPLHRNKKTDPTPRHAATDTSDLGKDATDLAVDVATFAVPDSWYTAAGHAILGVAASTGDTLAPIGGAIIDGLGSAGDIVGNVFEAVGDGIGDFIGSLFDGI